MESETDRMKRRMVGNFASATGGFSGVTGVCAATISQNPYAAGFSAALLYLSIEGYYLARDENPLCVRAAGKIKKGIRGLF